MNILKTLAIGAAICTAIVIPASANEPGEAGEVIHSSFESTDEFIFTDSQKTQIERVLRETHARVAETFPEVADQVSVSVRPVNRPVLDRIGGVTGRAERPDELIIEISHTFPSGVEGAVDNGLAETFFHELHHTVRGWTMSGNHYGHGIQIAVINEGLATVFAEEMTGEVREFFLPPSNIEAWAGEVLALPMNANYGEWMLLHPDGREAIGYRTGRWVVRRAMERSGLNIVSLTNLTPAAIWQLAGYNWDRQLRLDTSSS